MEKKKSQPNRNKSSAEAKIDSGELRHTISYEEVNHQTNANEEIGEEIGEYDYFVTYNKGADMVGQKNKK